MKALFEVGEEVSVSSENHQEFNGDYMIIEVKSPGTFNCKCGKRYSAKDYQYKLDGSFSIKQKCGCYHGAWAHEKSLRKKYKGVDFNEMMRELEGVKS